MIKIAIIGSDSYIAGKFAASCPADWEKVFVSRISTGNNQEIIQENLFDLKKDIFKNCNVAINFTAIVHQPKLKDAQLYQKVNTELAVSLAQKAKEAGVKHFIQMSTIAVYGNVREINIDSEEQPENDYGKSKLNADRKILGLQDENFHVSIIRPPMVYGAGAPGNMQKLVRFALKGYPLPFKGVDNLRDFIHVQNLAIALKAVIENKIFGIVIPTDKNPVSTVQILQYTKKHAKVKVRIIKVPKFILSIIRKVAPSVFEKVYGTLQVQCSLSEKIYTPRATVEDGIAETLDCIEKQL